LARLYFAQNEFLFENGVIMRSSTLAVLLAIIITFGPLEAQENNYGVYGDSLDPMEQYELDYERYEDELDAYEYKPKFGIYGQYGLNLHFAGFSKLPGVASCCDNYENGSGGGLSLGGLFEMSLPWHEKLSMSIRAGVVTQDGELIKTESNSTSVIVDDQLVDAEFEHSIGATLMVGGITPMVSYEVADNLSVLGGFSLGVLITKEYVYKEEITNPSTKGKYKDTGRRTRGESDGDLAEASSFQAGIIAGLSYELPLNAEGSMFIAPEVFYYFGFTPIVSGLDWSVHTVRGGLAFKFKEAAPEEPPPPPPYPAPYPKMRKPTKPPLLTVAVNAIQVDSLNKEKKNFKLKIEDFISHNMRPILNYVFFDSNSAELPPRYQQIKPKDKNKFNFKTMHNLGALDTYYHVLNIIGKRLQGLPDEKLTLVGTNYNIGAEKGNKDLSRRRAETVADYLKEVWDLKDDQIKIVSRNLPKEKSNNTDAEGQAENRRVEIIPRNWEILEPVITIDTLRKMSKTTVRFLPEANAEAGIAKWELKAEQSANKLIEFNGDSALPAKVDWTISEQDTSAPDHGGQISYRLKVTDSLGQVAESKIKRLPVEQITIDKKRLERKADMQFEYYSLILFDFGKSKLGKEHKKVLGFVKNRVTDESTVVISGHTDQSGDEKINKNISKKRAQAAASRLKIPNAKVEGMGESELLFDNTYPEGRFYCRTVRINIETPITDNGEEE
jgi:outer membrane protein OmpA-like peptidoglycan-associated protein